MGYMVRVCLFFIEDKRTRENEVDAIEVKVRSKKYYDRRTNPCTFEVGDNVLLLNESNNKHKFALQYCGPHNVLELIDNGRNVKITYRKGTRIVHPNKLRKVRMEDPESTVNSEEASDSSL